MNLESKLLWIIANDKYQEKGLDDGEGVFYDSEINGSHRDIGSDFCKKYGIPNYSDGGSHTDWGRFFSGLGFAVFFNSANPIDGEYYGQWFLPSNLTDNQIAFIESQKELFERKYSHNHSFFRVFVYPEENQEYSYKLTSGLRDLRIEEQIQGLQLNEIDGIETLYKELARQKEKNNQKRR